MNGKNAQILPGSPESVARAAELLLAGEVVAVPTETVYGLAGRADDADAVASIYRTKGRPDFNPLIVHVGSVEQAERYALLDERAHELARRFWPGSLTMVLPARQGSPIARAVTAGLPTIGLRMPAHECTLSLLAATDLPLAAPSANRSGGISPTRPEHVAASLGGEVPILDGGSCRAGLESTIVALRDDGTWQVLRPGPISAATIAEVLGCPREGSGQGIEAPGQLASHYAPGKPVRLDANTAQGTEFMIGFGGIAGDCSLSEAGDLAEAASRLYDCLHAAAASDKPGIAVAPIPGSGMGEAINDRLRRAAA